MIRKVLFLNPPLSMEERYGELAMGGAMEPPHGLTYLAAAAREAGFEASILDAEALGLPGKEVVERVLAAGPDVLACTAVTLSITSAAKIAAAVKEARPDIRAVIGGIHLTSMPEETMEAFPSFDYGVIGEGEVTLREMLPCLRARGALGGVPGVIYREGGELARTPPRGYIKDLDSLPMPAWDLLPPMKDFYYLPPQSVRKPPSTSIITSRGCTGKCTFCDTSVFGHVCRAHSAEYVLEMLKTLRRRYGIGEVLFEDDNFMIFKKRLTALCALLHKENLGLSWSCLARADMMKSGDLMREMRLAGCWQVLFGIESGSQEILDLERKGITLEQIEKAVRLARKSGLRTKGFIMVGHPTETPETIRQTIDFIRSLPLDDVSVTYFTAFPGSEIWKDAPRYGSVAADFSRMSVFHPSFIPNGFTEESLTASSRLILRKFYMRPRIFFSYMKRITDAAQFAALVRGGLALLRHLLFAGRRGRTRDGDHGSRLSPSSS